MMPDYDILVGEENRQHMQSKKKLQNKILVTLEMM
jgi:hypothetical protein